MLSYASRHVRGARACIKNDSCHLYSQRCGRFTSYSGIVRDMYFIWRKSPINCVILLNLFVLIVIFFVMFADFTQHPAWVSDGDNVCGNIFCNDASGANYRIVSDCNAWQDNYTGADPAVSSDMDGHIILIYLFPKLRKDGMTGSGYRYIWPDHCIITNVNMCIIHAGQMIVGIDHVSEMTVVSAKVCIKRRFDIYAFSAVAKHSIRGRKCFQNAKKRKIKK